MSTSTAKEIVYIYNGEKETTDTDYDPNGAFLVPELGGIVNRKGQDWKISRTTMQTQSSASLAMPVLTIDLTDRF